MQASPIGHLGDIVAPPQWYGGGMSLRDRQPLLPPPPFKTVCDGVIDNRKHLFYHVSMESSFFSRSPSNHRPSIHNPQPCPLEPQGPPGPPKRMVLLLALRFIRLKNGPLHPDLYMKNLGEPYSFCDNFLKRMPIPFWRCSPSNVFAGRVLLTRPVPHSLELFLHFS